VGSGVQLRVRSTEIEAGVFAEAPFGVFAAMSLTVGVSRDGAEYARRRLRAIEDQHFTRGQRRQLAGRRDPKSAAERRHRLVCIAADDQQPILERSAYVDIPSSDTASLDDAPR